MYRYLIFGLPLSMVTVLELPLSEIMQHFTKFMARFSKPSRSSVLQNLLRLRIWVGTMMTHLNERNKKVALNLQDRNYKVAWIYSEIMLLEISYYVSFGSLHYLLFIQYSPTSLSSSHIWLLYPCGSLLIVDLTDCMLIPITVDTDCTFMPPYC